jgi:hypothetical protein
MTQVVADAAHGARAERLYPRILERVKHGARFYIHRRNTRVQARVVMAEAKRG